MTQRQDIKSKNLDGKVFTTQLVNQKNKTKIYARTKEELFQQVSNKTRK